MFKCIIIFTLQILLNILTHQGFFPLQMKFGIDGVNLLVIVVLDDALLVVGLLLLSYLFLGVKGPGFGVEFVLLVVVTFLLVTFLLSLRVQKLGFLDRTGSIHVLSSDSILILIDLLIIGVGHFVQKLLGLGLRLLEVLFCLV